MSHERVISLSNVACSYRTRKSLFRQSVYQALRDVSLELRRGDTLGIVGRNGAGKTTLLRLIAGIIKPDRGQVSMVPGTSVAMLTLQAGFDPELTGRANLLLGGLILGFERKDVMSRLDRIIEFAELGEFIDEPLKTYSTGMRARLGFALALELSPDVLLVDEVLGVGDSSFRKKATAAMTEMMNSDQTVVFVSHDLRTVERLCTQAVWIDAGVAQCQGKPAEVIEEYLKSTRAV